MDLAGDRLGAQGLERLGLVLGLEQLGGVGDGELALVDPVADRRWQLQQGQASGDVLAGPPDGLGQAGEGPAGLAQAVEAGGFLTGGETSLELCRTPSPSE
ncbi:MAG: hypothetical protein ACRD0H_03715 [Actinomycetes bacterium]